MRDMRERKARLILGRFLCLAIYCVIASVILFSGNIQQETSQKSEYFDSDAYEIYALLIKPIIKEWGYEKEVVVHRQTTQGPSKNFFEEYCLKCPGNIPVEYEGLARNFKEENKKARFLNKKFSLAMAYRFASLEEVKEFRIANLPPSADAPPLKEKFRGYLEVSAVGFSSTRRLALAYVGHDCGALCGSGTYFVLEKKEGRWRVKGTFGDCGWVS